MPKCQESKGFLNRLRGMSPKEALGAFMRSAVLMLMLAPACNGDGNNNNDGGPDTDTGTDPSADCSDVDALLARHLDHVRERLKELASLEQTLEKLQAACSDGGTVSECGILGGLTSELDKLDMASDHNHVPGTHGQGHS